MSTDYYDTLEVGREATPEEIKKAYRRLARQYHPDVNSDPDAQAHFKDIQRAFAVLSDPQKRQMYDLGGDPYSSGGGMGAGFGGMGGMGGAGGINFTDIMDAFFGQSGQGRGPIPRAQPGKHAVIPLRLDLGEAAFGVTREIKIDTAVRCTKCGGEGTAPGTHPQTCQTCQGHGEVAQTQRSLLGEVRTLRPCPTCGGYGTTIPSPCPECSGEGRVLARRTVTVKIPAGVDTGNRVQLVGEGEVGPGGGPPGDLYVEIQVNPHDTFTRRGNDLHCTMTLPMTAAALGTSLPLTGLDGERTAVTIKPGTQSGSQQVLASRGVPKLRGTGRGDLVVHVVVETPTRLDDEQRELLRSLASVREESNPDGAVAPTHRSMFGRLREAFGQH